jgi:hypothetical protein
MMSKVTEYPWYVSPPERAEIEQGDFLFNFPIIEPSLKMDTRKKQIAADRVLYNLIVISHSCDIADKTLDEIGLIQLLPVFGYEDFVNQIGMNGSNQGNLHKDRLTAHQLLEKCSIKHTDIPKDHLVVSFLELKVAPIEQVRSFLRKRNGPPRVRLAHPYREKLTGRFSSIYSRVGLPNDLIKPDKIQATSTSASS